MKNIEEILKKLKSDLMIILPELDSFYRWSTVYNTGQFFINHQKIKEDVLKLLVNVCYEYKDKYDEKLTIIFTNKHIDDDWDYHTNVIYYIRKDNSESKIKLNSGNRFDEFWKDTSFLEEIKRQNEKKQYKLSMSEDDIKKLSDVVFGPSDFEIENE
jgi:hypothetical protein